jgi:hypothetical protein
MILIYYWEAFQKNELSKEEVLTHRFINYFKEYGIDVDGKKADVLFREASSSLNKTSAFLPSTSMPYSLK